MIKVMVADDHPIIRKGLKQILADAGDMLVAGEAGDGNEVLNKIRKETYNVLLLDLSMPGISGMDIIKQLKKEQPALAVLVLSRYPEEQYAIPAIKAGASGYVPKTGVVEELVEAIRRVSKGRKYLTASLAERLIEFGDNIEKPLHTVLSDREQEILRLIASGKGISDIAKNLCLSPTTISTYRSRIMKKMRMGNDSELIRYALENKLIE